MATRPVRILAESAVDAPDDVLWKLVLDALVDGFTLKKQMCFGFASNSEDGPNKRWPFILRPEGGKWVVDYGAESEDTPQPCNIVEREIRLGAYFTIWYGSEEVTMRIIQINDLE